MFLNGISNDGAALIVLAGIAIIWGFILWYYLLQEKEILWELVKND